MIPYEELVVALRSWRERNGLPIGSAEVLTNVSVPPLTPGPAEVAPMAAHDPGLAGGGDVEQIYDLSDDSGLIEAEVLDGADAWGEPGGGEADAVASESYAAANDAAYPDRAPEYAAADYPPDAAYPDQSPEYAAADYPPDAAYPDRAPEYAAADYPPDAAYPDPAPEYAAAEPAPAEPAFAQDDGYGEAQPFDPMATYDPAAPAPPQSSEETYIGGAPQFPGQFPDDGMTAVAHAPLDPPGADAEVEISDEAIVGEVQDDRPGGVEAPDPDEATQIHRAVEHADGAPHESPDAVHDIGVHDVLSEEDEQVGRDPGHDPHSRG